MKSGCRGGMKMNRIFIIIICCFFGLVSCSSNTVYELPKPDQLLKPDQALEAGVFRLVRDSSWVVVKVLKNDHIPVKGTLNFLTGMMNVKKGEPFKGELVIDMLSWDSGLSLRDKNVSEILFALNTEKSDYYKQTNVKITKIPLQIYHDLIKSKVVNGVEVGGVIEFQGKKYNIKPKIDLKFSEKHHLVSKTSEPIKMKLSDLGLTGAIGKLLEMAERNKIADEIEITFHVEWASPK